MTDNTPRTSAILQKVSHYGTIHIGDLAFDGVVLEDGTRGYIQKQLMPVFGVQFGRGSQGRDFLAKFAPKYLSDKSKSDVVEAVRMPHGGRGKIYRVGILSELPLNVIKAALSGDLHHTQQHIVPHCIAIVEALAKTGEVALIDEATGYQYHREPDALQDFISRVLRQTCATWERRFHPDYYEATFRLFGWSYSGQQRKPSVIGQITARWVYESVFPVEIMAEVRERKGEEKIHQWLTEDGGLPLLEKQINAVTMIARSSTDLPDFNNRCAIAFHSKGQMGFVFPSPAHDQAA
jgi:hypothetical protein